jgi:A1 cistron-splicing factor AAR2
MSNTSQVIGELQFTFLMVLTINNFSCLEQWRRILTLVFTCRSAIPRHPHLFINAISTLRLQLQHCKDAEGGLIDLADEGGSLLKSLLARFRKGLEGLTGTAVADVVDELDDLEDYLRNEHGWQFGGDFARSGVLELEDGEQVQMDSTAFDEDDETGEFAPQVVDLTPEQARLLNVSPEDARDLGLSLSRASLADRNVSEVVEDSGSDDDDEVEELVRRDESDSEEEMQDLEDMDARY